MMPVKSRVNKKVLKKDKPSKAVQIVDDLFNGDIDLALFFAAWLENGRNATRAYKQVHPDAMDSSCRVLGSKVLAKIDKKIIVEAYNLNIDRYLTKIDEGLDATKKHNYTGEVVKDQQTQQFYHDKLGELLEFEGKAAQLTINNIVVTPILSNLTNVSSYDGDSQDTKAEEAN